MGMRSLDWENESELARKQIPRATRTVLAIETEAVLE
jgi:hypothetical protein